MAEYSYNPANITRNGVDKMRFELGDTVLEPASLACSLCNEEYAAILAQNKEWRRAKIACLKAILIKFAYEVDFSADGLSYSLSQRYERFKALLNEEESKLAALSSVPRFDKSSIGGGHYFYNNLHVNPRKF